MTRRDLATIMLSAVATMGLSLALFTALPAIGVAEKEDKTIAVPTLKTGETELSLQFSADKRVTVKDGAITIAAGDLPGMELQAVNHGTKDATVTYKVNVSAQSLQDTMSRVPRDNSKAVWEYSSTITVPAGKTITAKLDSTGKLAAGAFGRVRLTVDKEAIIATSFSVPMVTKTDSVSKAAPRVNASKSKVAQAKAKPAAQGG